MAEVWGTEGQDTLNRERDPETYRGGAEKVSSGDHLDLTQGHREQVQLAGPHLLYCMMGQVGQETDVWKASYIPENLRVEEFNIT